VIAPFFRENAEGRGAFKSLTTGISRVANASDAILKEAQNRVREPATVNWRYQALSQLSALCSTLSDGIANFPFGRIWLKHGPKVSHDGTA
jgi:hypothetical protein